MQEFRMDVKHSTHNAEYTKVYVKYTEVYNISYFKIS